MVRDAGPNRDCESRLRKLIMIMIKDQDTGPDRDHRSWLGMMVLIVIMIVNQDYGY
jgi:hypothetical protein